MPCMIHQHHPLPGQSSKHFQSPFFICFISGPPQQPWRVSTTVFARILGRFLVGSCHHDNSRVCTAYRFYVEFVSNTVQIKNSITVKTIRNSYVLISHNDNRTLACLLPLLPCYSCSLLEYRDYISVMQTMSKIRTVRTCTANFRIERLTKFRSERDSNLCVYTAFSPLSRYSYILHQPITSFFFLFFLIK